jgi:hypothetical protein
MRLVLYESVCSKLEEMGAVVQQKEEDQHVLKCRINLAQDQVHHGNLRSVAHHIEAASKSGGLVKDSCYFAVDSVQ